MVLASASAHSAVSLHDRGPTRAALETVGHREQILRRSLTARGQIVAETRIT